MQVASEDDAVEVEVGWSMTYASIAAVAHAARMANTWRESAELICGGGGFVCGVSKSRKVKVGD